ncbi:hypothetical protein MVES_002387 [Malassezia vespertilionis]|uniref:DNA ligase n=1 Tax=Malassezia vespertilionis TaxID=2020962 RepID=A0A2N1JAG7_9BASI|nr:hypothetical protein MVES_002387 [Malassezia vespertilionis]
MLVDMFVKVEATTKRLEILQYVTSLFVDVIAHCTKNGDATEASANLLYAVYLCINRLCPDYEGLEIGIGEGLLVKAIAQSTGREIARIKKDLEAKGDLGLVALASRKNQPTMFHAQKLTLPFVFKQLKEIAKASGNKSQDKKLGIIKRLLAACAGDESKYLIRSLEGKLRIGLAEKTVLVALAHAVILAKLGEEAESVPKEELAAALESGTTIVKAVFSELPSYDLLIPALLEHSLDSLQERLRLTPGIPLKPMLAKPTKEIGEVLDRFEEKVFTCEFKYDGERAQVHGYPNKDGKLELRVFSRNSEDMSMKYPDLVVQVPHSLRDAVESFVLDAEAVAWESTAGDDENGTEGRLLPFQELSRRKRKDVRAEDIKVKVKLFAFDLLFLNGKPLLHKEMDERRALLMKHFQPVQCEFGYATHRDCTTVEEIQTFLDESVKSGCEGLMVKMLKGPDSTYEPSRRSINWLKIKKDYLSGTGDSLDLAVIGGYYGKGKRTNVYGAFLLACYDDEQEAYQSICKIGTGFSEADLEAHYNNLKPLEIETKKGYYDVGEAKPDVYFEPRVVPVYTAAKGMIDARGISLRFPRFILYLFELFISLRQYQLYAKPTPPKALVPYVSMETFQKSQAYGRDKARFSIISDACSHLFNLFMVSCDIYAWAWVWSGALLALFGAPQNELTQSAMWVIVTTAIREVESIPLSLYRNFVIEERHGFNKLTLSTYVADTIKEWVMGIIIGAPLTALLVAVIRWAGDYFVMYTVFLFTAIALFGNVIYPVLIQPLFNKLTPLPDGALRDRVMALALALNFPLKDLYVIDGSKRSGHSNAYFYGIIPGGNKHIVIYDTLIEKSTPEEIEAVLAHELGHWAHSDPSKLLVLMQANMVLMLSLFTLFIHNASLFRAFGFQLGVGTSNAPVTESYLPVLVGLELFQLVFNPTDAVLKFAINAFVRHIEYAADRFAANLARPFPTPSQLEAERLLKGDMSLSEKPDATVLDWVERLNKTDPVSGEIVVSEQAQYTELLGRSLVKLHIQKCVSNVY